MCGTLLHTTQHLTWCYSGINGIWLTVQLIKYLPLSNQPSQLLMAYLLLVRSFFFAVINRNATQYFGKLTGYVMLFTWPLINIHTMKARDRFTLEFPSWLPARVWTLRMTSRVLCGILIQPGATIRWCWQEIFCIGHFCLIQYGFLCVTLIFKS